MPLSKSDQDRINDLITKKMNSIFNTSNDMNQPGFDRREYKMQTFDSFTHKDDDGGSPANSYPPTAT